MITPKKRRHSESLTRAKNVARSSLALALSHDPVLDAHTTRVRIGPTRDVAGCKNSRDVRFQKFVDHDAVVSGNARFFGQRYIWPNADSHDHQVAIQNRSIIQLHMAIFDSRRRSPEMKFYAVRLMSFANEISQFAPKNLLQRQRFFSDDSDFKFALAQGSRHLQPDEACADHDRALRVFRFLDDASAVA